MQIQCDCDKFCAELKAFPKNTPGRLVCYCDDCQTYLHYLKRSDLLDKNGGTEVIPAYPADIDFIRGKEYLKCTRLSENGILRFSTTCCNTPVANVRPNTPWVGIVRCVYISKDPLKLDQVLGPVRSRIQGRFAKGTPPKGTPQAFNLRALVGVMPFIIKGKILKKMMPSPFFAEDGQTLIVSPHVLNKDELHSARVAAQV